MHFIWFILMLNWTVLTENYVDNRQQVLIIPTGQTRVLDVIPLITRLHNRAFAGFARVTLTGPLNALPLVWKRFQYFVHKQWRKIFHGKPYRKVIPVHFTFAAAVMEPAGKPLVHYRLPVTAITPYLFIYRSVVVQRGHVPHCTGRPEWL